MTFHLFKNVYLELASAFQYHHSNDHDCILLTEQFDSVLPPEHTRLVFKYADLDSIIADKFGGYVEEFFKALFDYTNSTGKRLVVFCQDADFSRLVLQYYRDLYPSISDLTLMNLHDKVVDRIFLQSTSFAWSNAKSKKAYRSFGRDSAALQLQIQNTQHRLDYTPEMKQALPFEALYCDYAVSHGQSAYVPALLKHIREFSIFELRNVILSICDGVLSVSYKMKNYFPEVRPLHLLSDTFKNLRFTLLFDEKAVSHDSRNWSDDAEDLQHIFKAYTPEYIEYLLEKCFELANVSPLLQQNNSALMAAWKTYSHAVRENAYLELLESPEARLIDVMAVHHTYRSKYNWLMISHVIDLTERKPDEAQNFRL